MAPYQSTSMKRKPTNHHPAAIYNQFSSKRPHYNNNFAIHNQYPSPPSPLQKASSNTLATRIQTTPSRPSHPSNRQTIPLAPPRHRSLDQALTLRNRPLILPPSNPHLLPNRRNPNLQTPPPSLQALEPPLQPCPLRYLDHMRIPRILGQRQQSCQLRAPKELR